MKIPVKKQTLEKIVIIARNLGEDEVKHGSVSIPIETYFGENSEHSLSKQYSQWITLFDHPDDDEYDGNLEEDDEEIPRVHV